MSVEGAISAWGEAQDANFLLAVYTRPVQRALVLAQSAAPARRRAGLSALLTQPPNLKERFEFKAGSDRGAHVQKYEFKSGDVTET